MAGIIRCPNGHTSATAAKVGGTTSCPQCRADGRGRVSCRVKAAPAAAAAASGADSAAAETAWAAEGPPVPWHENLGSEGGQECPSCGKPMRWTGAHTALICPAQECRAWSVSPDARQRSAARSAALERRERREVAISATEARATRVQLRAWQDTLTQHAERLLDECNPDDYDRVQDQRAAFEFGATVRGYLPEIRAASSAAELTEILQEIEAIRTGPQFAELSQERERAADRREQQQRAAAEHAEHMRQWEAQQREAERQARELERRQAAELERETRALAARGETRRVIATPQTNVGSTAMALALVAQQRQKAIETKGACGFKHPWSLSGGVPAARLFGIQVQTWRGTHLSDEHPSIRACPKHFDAAAQWMQEQGLPQCTYWEL